MTDAVVSPPQVRWAANRAWKKFRSGTGALVGLVLVSFFVALAILAPILPIADPAAQDWAAVRYGSRAAGSKGQPRSAQARNNRRRAPHHG